MGLRGELSARELVDWPLGEAASLVLGLVSPPGGSGDGGAVTQRFRAGLITFRRSTGALPTPHIRTPRMGGARGTPLSAVSCRLSDTRALGQPAARHWGLLDALLVRGEEGVVNPEVRAAGGIVIGQVELDIVSGAVGFNKIFDRPRLRLDAVDSILQGGVAVHQTVSAVDRAQHKAAAAVLVGLIAIEMTPVIVDHESVAVIHGGDVVVDLIVPGILAQLDGKAGGVAGTGDAAYLSRFRVDQVDSDGEVADGTGAMNHHVAGQAGGAGRRECRCRRRIP